MKYNEFFERATSYRPYPYQVRFADADRLPHLLRAPTAAGKTATAILGWLWRQQQGRAPRRLVYCLPMRVLVEQSKAAAEEWIHSLGVNVKVHVLMGGVELDDWHLDPEKPAILLGTQDMLLSRALNRGYAESRFHWPIDFGLLHSDCLWVFDEPQLMANGVSTSAQLAGLRKKLGVFGDCPSVWMSATLEPVWLDTVDFRGEFLEPPLELTDDDYEPTLPLNHRMTADKTLVKANAESSKDMKAAAKEVLTKHVAGTQTLAVVNTVDRAKALYEELRKLVKKANGSALLLVHSRYRPKERQSLNEKLQDKSAGDRIVVATQVVEAGVDVSARTLVTELAPWASIVQRFGRCNRTGQDGPGCAFWLDLENKLAPPYDENELLAARGFLLKLEGEQVSPKALDEFTSKEKIVLLFEHKHVLRRRDLLDLFDTTPDLSGNDIDIQRFVRSDDQDISVSVFWREWTGEVPPDDLAAPRREELCNVPIGPLTDFLEKLNEKKKHAAWLWDHIDEVWRTVDARSLRPGLTILLPAAAGGYSRELGWDPTSGPVPVVETVAGPPPEGVSSDRQSQTSTPYTIAEHTQHVCDELDSILKDVPFLAEFSEDLKTAALWHDLGKRHATFQSALFRANDQLDRNKHWAKSGKQTRLRYKPRYFRHELVSALATLGDFPFLVSYLMAAHHGRVRLAIRSVPSEADGHVLGVCENDPVPAVDLGGNAHSSDRTVSLAPMALGNDPSWTAQALELLAKLGPFKLAYFEAVLRAADARASQKEGARG